MQLNERLAIITTKFNEGLGRYLENFAGVSSATLLPAMRYAVLNGGKRLRALLVYVVGRYYGARDEQLIYPAMAIELIHAYSLVHDDLPAMDDADLRRGQAACHKVYGEALAILVGDALQSLAFAALTDEQCTLAAPQKIAMVQTLAQASGVTGMAEGQALDLAAEGKHLNLRELQQLHQHKTGALLQAAIAFGYYCGQTDTILPVALSEFAEHVGLAYQIVDDILDVTAASEDLGKVVKHDVALDKCTYVTVLGLSAAQQAAADEYAAALNCLYRLSGNTDELQQLLDMMIKRDF